MGECVGLRVDVDTYRGTRDGVPGLLEVLADYGIHASFFFSVGPDNMGRHLWRLLKPAFLLKMIRSKAASLYGWDILLRGTFWPGPAIGMALAQVIKTTSDADHEVGLHAWDHHAWQVRLDKMSSSEIRGEFSRGMRELERILGFTPSCSASAGWKCNEKVLLVKEEYEMRYNSDCRGTSIFRPLIDDVTGAPQIPSTLPTYDEVVGRNGVTDENYNAFLLDRIRPGQLNVLTIHAEVEGIAKRSLFREFLDLAATRRVRFVPIGDLLPGIDEIPAGRITQGTITGRQGALCVQMNR